MIIIVLQHNFCHPHQPMCYKSIEIFDLLSDSGKTNTTDEKNMNDATNGKDTKDNKGDGAVDNAVDDATDAVDDAADDLTDNNGPEKDNLEDRNTNDKDVNNNDAANNTDNNAADNQ